MNFDSQDPFNFEIPELKSRPLFLRLAFFLLAIFFIIVPLYLINQDVFMTNEVIFIIDCGHEFCQSHSGCILSSH